MNIDPLFLWLQNTSIATAIRQSTLLFPWIESIHVLAITVVVGTIAVVDLRLLGLASREEPVSQLLAQVLPFTQRAFAVATVTGGLLFLSHADEYMHKAPFVAKLVLLVLALINILVFHSVTVRSVDRWNTAVRPPMSARLAGGLSLGIWIGVVACGRWVGFV